MMIRVHVVDDQALIRGGLVALFTAAPGPQGRRRGTHVKRVMAKVHLTNRAQAVVMAYETGLVVPTSAKDGRRVRPL